MRRTPVIICLSILLACLAGGPAKALDEPPPPNAIVSEGNGAAVFIGYGADKSVNLSWRPSKKYEGGDMLYQVQRSDGAMLESKTSAASFRDINLTPNTIYGYTLITFQSIKKKYLVTKGPSKGQTIIRTTTKRVGRNQIDVLTLPSMVVGIQATTGLDSADLVWQPPQYVANPVTYSVYLGPNLMAYGLTTGQFHLGSLTCSNSYSVTVVTQNATGDSPAPAKIAAKTTTCPKAP
jgi:hypothetical protein